MANEVSIQASIRINNGSLQWESRPANYNANQTGTKGPTPGAIAVSVAGTNVDLSELTNPGWCYLANLDDTNFVTYGIWDPEVGRYYPLGELEPGGKPTVLKLASDIQEEYGTGTGTLGPDTNRLRLKADTAACSVVVAAFER